MTGMHYTGTAAANFPEGSISDAAGGGSKPAVQVGGRVRKDSTNIIIGAIAAAVIAFSAATCANAQTSGGMPNDASAQSQSIAASPARNRPDSELARDVRRALSRTPNLHSTAIHVQARHGIVTLTGWVPQRAQVQRAGSVARSVRGVRHVNNHLNVRTRGASGH